MQTPPAQRRERQAGFTLIEILISMIIMAVVGTMLVGIWISLQRSFEFTQSDNTAASTGRDALDRVSSELRDAQPSTASTATPFCLTLSSPYVCDANDCTFYSPYNNPSTAQTAVYVPTSGESTSVLTSIYLDTSGTSPEKTLWLVRDTNHDGVFDTGDQMIKLATNVVNTSTKINKPIFSYLLHASATASFVPAASLTSANVGQVVAVNIELVVDSNLNARPTYFDLVSTVRPRNVTDY